ncbi:hypothetical protein HYI36_20235 [Bacillus sp. Gen3]|nr:hypothetical protein [Bacillus sp. Gen3]
MNYTKKLNNLVLEYQKNRKDDVFNQIYDILTNKIFATSSWDKLVESTAFSLKTGTHEVIEVFEDTLLRCIDRYNPTDDFIKLFSLSFKRAKINLHKKRKYVLNNELFNCDTEDDEDTTSIIENIASHELTDEIVWEKHKKADQLALIDSLLSDADELTTAIVNTLIEKPDLNRLAVGKHLGIHHSVVYRKIERLARKFDSKKHGDYRDLLVAI